jgi:hypothetical protein
MRQQLDTLPQRTCAPTRFHVMAKLADTVRPVTKGSDRSLFSPLPKARIGDSSVRRR